MIKNDDDELMRLYTEAVHAPGRDNPFVGGYRRGMRGPVEAYNAVVAAMASLGYDKHVDPEHFLGSHFAEDLGYRIADKEVPTDPKNPEFVALLKASIAQYLEMYTGL